MSSSSRKELSEWNKGRIEGQSEYISDGQIGCNLQIPGEQYPTFCHVLENDNLRETFLDLDIHE